MLPLGAVALGPKVPRSSARTQAVSPRPGAAGVHREGMLIGCVLLAPTRSFWWTDLVAATDSLGGLAFGVDDRGVGRAVDWYVDNQAPNGLWNTGPNRPKDPSSDLWVAPRGRPRIEPWLRPDGSITTGRIDGEDDSFTGLRPFVDERGVVELQPRPEGGSKVVRFRAPM